MKILLVRGSPRKSGYTNRITDIVARGALRAGAELVDIDLARADINECTGCCGCLPASSGKCIFEDDMTRLLKILLESDILLCSTPLYHYGMSSCLKRFLERTLPLTKGTSEQTGSGSIRNGVRHPKAWENKGIGYICAGALLGTENFDGLRETFRTLARGLEMKLCAALERPEAYLLSFEQGRPRKLKAVTTALEQAGLQLAQSGRVSEETQAQVSIQLARDAEQFMMYSEVYWRKAAELGPRAQDLDAVRDAVLSDMDLVLAEMAEYFDPSAAGRLRAKVQFTFTDIERKYGLLIEKDTCRFMTGPVENPDMEITCETRTWSQVFRRSIDMRKALAQRHLVVTGDKTILLKFEKLFPPPQE